MHGVLQTGRFLVAASLAGFVALYHTLRTRVLERGDDLGVGRRAPQVRLDPGKIVTMAEEGTRVATGTVTELAAVAAPQVSPRTRARDMALGSAIGWRAGGAVVVVQVRRVRAGAGVAELVR